MSTPLGRVPPQRKTLTVTCVAEISCDGKDWQACKTTSRGIRPRDAPEATAQELLSETARFSPHHWWRAQWALTRDGRMVDGGEIHEPAPNASGCDCIQY